MCKTGLCNKLSFVLLKKKTSIVLIEVTILIVCEH